MLRRYLYEKLETLSETHGRLLLGGIVILWVLVVVDESQRLLQILIHQRQGMYEKLPAAKRRLKELQHNLSIVRGELSLYEAQVATLTESIQASGEELVIALDRAADQTGIHMGTLSTIGRRGASLHGEERRYQLQIFGRYPNIVNFIRIVSDCNVPFAIVDVVIKASTWSYPAQPLEAVIAFEPLSPQGSLIQ